MGWFGKKKSPEKILEEGRIQYEKGDWKKAFLTLHDLAGKGNPEASYYVGSIYLERKEKNLARSFLTQAAKGGVREAAALLEKEFGVQAYLPGEELPAQPAPAPAPFPKEEGTSGVDDLMEELEETGAFIQQARRELKQAEKQVRMEKTSRPKPRAAAEEPAPVPSATAPVHQPEPKKKMGPAPAQNTEAAEMAGGGSIVVDHDRCLTLSMCGLCLFKCKQEAITIDRERDGISIHIQGCTKCGACVEICPASAIHIQQG